MKFAAVFALLASVATSAHAASLNCTVVDSKSKQPLIAPVSLPINGDIAPTAVASLQGTLLKASLTGKQVELTAEAGQRPFNFSSLSSSSKKKARLTAVVGQSLVQFDCAISK